MSKKREQQIRRAMKQEPQYKRNRGRAEDDWDYIHNEMNGELDWQSNEYDLTLTRFGTTYNVDEFDGLREATQFCQALETIEDAMGWSKRNEKSIDRYISDVRKRR